MKIFFSAGEPSGDLHGANLIRALKARHPQLEAVGYGGPNMAEAGCRLHADLTELAVMWIVRAVANLHRFLDLAGRADRYFRHQRPDAVVLIDFPGFNWWIARRAKAHDIPVYYYAPPQIWAWATHRVRKMRRLIDHVLCGLPFEAAWLRERGCRVSYVGHPYFDELAAQRLDPSFLTQQQQQGGRLVTILPGSRTQEVLGNLEDLLNAARRIHESVPDARFAVAAFKPSHAELARERAAQYGLPIEVFVGRTAELIELSECCLAVSGSVSLELLHRTKPTVIVYRIGPLADQLQWYVRKVKYITLVNLLATEDLFPQMITPYDPAAPEHRDALFPEYVSSRDRSAEIAAHAIGWLTDENCRGRLIARLESLRQQFGQPGAAERAAELILGSIPRPESTVPAPHFVSRRLGTALLRK